MTDPSEQIQLLGRALEREKSARRQAEQQLEQMSREIYMSNQQLLQHVEEVKANQVEQAFQLALAQELVDLHDEHTLLSLTSQRIGTHLNASEVVFGLLHRPSECFSLEGVKSGTESEAICLGAQALLVERIHRETPLLELNTCDLPQSLQAIQAEEDNSALLLHWPMSPDVDACQIYFLSHPLRGQATQWQGLESALGLIFAVSGRIEAERKTEKNVQALKTSIAELKSARDQLVSQEKVVAVGQLAAGIAHEINNPVGYALSNLVQVEEYIQDLLAYLKVLEAGVTMDDALATTRNELDIDYLIEDAPAASCSAKEGLNKIRDIINSMKTFARKGEQCKQLMCLSEPIEAALVMVWNQLKYDHKVEKDMISDAWVLVDKGELQQVFTNLFVNAAHAMPEGGTLHIALAREGESIVARVSDTGMGMDKTTREKVFQAFFTTKAPGVGTGLGLSLSASVIKAHGGSIEVDSEPGKGSCFTLKLPAQGKA